MSNPFYMLSSNGKFGSLGFATLPHHSCIPAGIATELCKGRCFAFTKYYADRPKAFRFVQKNDAMRQGEHFATMMIYQIERAGVKDFRIHSIGDWDTHEYLDAWLSIVKACSEVRFLAYTRAWRDARFIDGLTKLAALPNMNLWLSEDVETGPSPKIPNTRVAWLACNDAELPPDHANLAFRATVERLTELYYEGEKVKARRRFTPLKVMGNNVTVCPHENGLPNMPKTCVECRICMWRTK